MSELCVYIQRPDREDLYDPKVEMAPIQCGACGNIDVIDAYDCLGAGLDNLWCNACGEELRPCPQKSAQDGGGKTHSRRARKAKP